MRPGRYNNEGWLTALSWLLALVAAIAIAALIVGAIALSKENSEQQTDPEMWEYPAGKMQLPNNYSCPQFNYVDKQLQITGFNLVFGRDIIIDADPGTYLIPTENHEGTYHFDFQVLAIARPTLLLKRNSLSENNELKYVKRSVNSDKQNNEQNPSDTPTNLEKDEQKSSDKRIDYENNQLIPNEKQKQLVHLQNVTKKLF
jgi:hypothetical protein